MTEPNLLPPPDPAPDVTVPPSSPARRNLAPWLYGLGFLILAVAIIYVWQYPNTPSDSTDEQAAIQAIGQRLADLDARLNKVEQRPVIDTGRITTRLDALEGRVADQTQLPARLDALSGRIESLSGRDQAGIDAAKQQIAALTTRVAAVESNAGNIAAVTQRLNRIARLQEASIALAAGRAIGDVPDAPDALARYSHAPPPTEADLRLRFPEAEKAALAAHQPDEADAPFLGRVWDRAQGLVTVRRGEDVVVGNPASVVLNRAQTALDAGDLAGAIETLRSLKGPPGQAIAAWISDAQALLDARTALAQLAAQA
jgi:hypothetical protein